MKPYGFIYLIIFACIACNRNTIQQTVLPPKKDSIKVVKDSPKALRHEDSIPTKDITYKVGSYLICCGRPMNYEIVTKGHTAKSALNDTLVYDKDTIILGDLNAIYPSVAASMYVCMGNEDAKEGIYKQYKKHFKFSEFKVDSIYKGKLVPPNMKSDPGARYYRTLIKGYGALNPDYSKKQNIVDFAGHYTVIACGKQGVTQLLAIVDRTNGKVFHQFPFGTFSELFGVDYSADSRMIMINSNILDLIPGYSLLKDEANDFTDSQPEIYVWKDSTFARLQ